MMPNQQFERKSINHHLQKKFTWNESEYVKRINDLIHFISKVILGLTQVNSRKNEI